MWKLDTDAPELLGIATSLPELLLVLEQLIGLDTEWQEELQITDMVAFLMFEGLALFLGVLLVPMLFTHVPLACGNMTAIEGNYSNMENPYNLGFSASQKVSFAAQERG
ncbi:unnamed protein product [Effrenium voratum]|uniref:Uncharacterized protein n=1 Tax=Effrenium voratum TaxID=2562239 RepID=A0AA36J9H9_9DINO|nr:unnamed protein product [Effrenium voratum]